MHSSGDIIPLTTGAWRLRAPLAASSYGVLWRAEHAATGQPAALKLVNREQMGRAPAALQGHWRACACAEADFLRALQPWDARHIVRLLDSGTHLGHPALALELLDGDLAAHLAAAGRRAGRWTISFAQALDWIGQVNTALARVHGYGWRHLDLKPANLLIETSSGTLRLADFGTCRPLADARAHAYAGTAGWQSPEQSTLARADADACYTTDARSDYFALGMLLYYFVTGNRLRYAAACTLAFRARAGAGAGADADAASIPAAVPAAIAPILAPDEAALFLRHAIDAGAAHDAALGLLRSLLAAQPAARPRHALDISRLIAGARTAAPMLAPRRLGRAA